MRSILVLVWAAVQAVAAAAAGTDVGSAVPQPACASHEPGGEVRDIECPLIAADGPRRFRFQAHFAGGHDDTMASLAGSLDGVPLACEPGSKTSLFGEYGEVSLLCSFSIDSAAGATHVMRMRVAWSHAQYMDFRFEAE